MTGPEGSPNDGSLWLTRGRRTRTVPSLSLAVALASISLFLDAVAATCLSLTRQMVLRPLAMLAVAQDLARAASLYATTSAENVSGADPNFLLLTTLHGHAARSSRTKTFPVTSTASFC